MVGDAFVDGTGTATGADSDHFFGDAGKDLIVGDSYSSRGDAVGFANDAGTGGKNDDTMVGDNAAGGSGDGGGDDIWLGNKGNDLLIGDNLALGHGHVHGGGGDDLRGGSGNDRFKAGPGRDECQGSSGHDDDLSRPRCEVPTHIP
jgi:hypothetical protein